MYPQASLCTLDLSHWYAATGHMVWWPIRSIEFFLYLSQFFLSFFMFFLVFPLFFLFFLILFLFYLFSLFYFSKKQIIINKKADFFKIFFQKLRKKKHLHVAHEGHKPTEAIAHQAFRLQISPMHSGIVDCVYVYVMCQTLSVILRNVEAEKAGLGCVQSENAHSLSSSPCGFTSVIMAYTRFLGTLKP